MWKDSEVLKTVGSTRNVFGLNVMRMQPRLMAEKWEGKDHQEGDNRGRTWHLLAYQERNLAPFSGVISQLWWRHLTLISAVLIRQEEDNREIVHSVLGSQVKLSQIKSAHLFHMSTLSFPYVIFTVRLMVGRQEQNVSNWKNRSLSFHWNTIKRARLKNTCFLLMNESLHTYGF